LAGVSRRVTVARANSGADSVKEASAEMMDSINSGAEELAEKVQKYWEESDDKPTIVATGFGALLALYFLNSVVSALDKLPLISNAFELVGIVFSGWTAYRYFLVEGEKEKLNADVKAFASKIGIDL